MSRNPGFGRRVKARRDRLGADRELLAELTGIGLWWLKRIEVGQLDASDLTKDELARLAEVLQFTQDWLVHGRQPTAAPLGVGIIANRSRSGSATIVRLGSLSCWKVVFIVWRFATKLGSSRKLRVSWSVRPAGFRCFVPKHAPADSTSGIYATFVTARRSLRQETLDLGSLRGRHVVESARFGDHVLSIVHEPTLSREGSDAG